MICDVNVRSFQTLIYDLTFLVNKSNINDINFKIINLNTKSKQLYLKYCV